MRQPLAPVITRPHQSKSEEVRGHEEQKVLLLLLRVHPLLVHRAGAAALLHRTLRQTMWLFLAAARKELTHGRRAWRASRGRFTRLLLAPQQYWTLITRTLWEEAWVLSTLG